MSKMTPEMAQMFDPCSVAPTVLGSNIAPTNPDVEVVAMLLKDTPGNQHGFHALDKGSRGWVLTSYVVLGVGPPGFSSVPYTNGKKKDPAESKKLYDYDESGGTRFYSYEVGRTNKDRGVRASVAEIDGENVDVSVTLKPGMCFNEFLRPDNYSDKVIVEGDLDVLPAFTLVYIQMGVANIEQAAKGRMLKLKKIKTITQAELQSCLFCSYNMPSTEDDFRARNNTNTYKSIRECLDSRSNTMVLNRKVASGAYIVQDTDSDDYVLVDMDGEFDMAHLDEKALQNVLPSASLQEKVKFLNICIVSGGVTAIVRSRAADSVVLNGDGDKYRARVVALTVNYNDVLGLNKDELTSGYKGECPMKVGTNFVLWTKNNTWPGSSKIIYYKLELPDKSTEGNELESTSFIDKGHSSTHKVLKITMLEDHFSDVFSAYEAANDGGTEPPSVMTLEVRFANKNAASVLGKRPRPALEFE